jgi:hypothetical protein
MKLTYRDVLDNREALNEALIEARRERARMVHRYLFAPLVRLFSAPPARRTRMLRRSAYC